MSKTRERDIELYMLDILLAIQKIKKYTNSFHNGEDLLHTEINWDATIRQFEIIGIALNHLLDDEKFTKASPAYFRKIVNFRNTIAHGYFGVNSEEVWDIVTSKLTLLESDMEEVINKNFNISHAIELEIQKYKELPDSTIYDYLQLLQKDMLAR